MNNLTGTELRIMMTLMNIEELLILLIDNAQGKEIDQAKYDAYKMLHKSANKLTSIAAIKELFTVLKEENEEKEEKE